jgi:hypothetical protein
MEIKVNCSMHDGLPIVKIPGLKNPFHNIQSYSRNTKVMLKISNDRYIGIAYRFH